MKLLYIEINEGGADLESFTEVEDLVSAMRAQPREAEEIREWASFASEGSVLSWRMGWVFASNGNQTRVKSKWRAKP